MYIPVFIFVDFGQVQNCANFNFHGFSSMPPMMMMLMPSLGQAQTKHTRRYTPTKANLPGHVSKSWEEGVGCWELGVGSREYRLWNMKYRVRIRLPAYTYVPANIGVYK